MRAKAVPATVSRRRVALQAGRRALERGVGWSLTSSRGSAAGSELVDELGEPVEQARRRRRRDAGGFGQAAHVQPRALGERLEQVELGGSQTDPILTPEA